MNLEEQNLLNKIIEMCQSNSLVKQAKKEDFNIFTVLRKKDEEVRLHSAFISHLLDPKGNHAMGDRFLKLFLKEVLSGDTIINFCDTPVVNPESSEGEYGRLDIKINDSDQCIVIENKINAADGSEQLYRYKKSLIKKNYKNWKIIYLTKYGDIPNNESLNSSDKNGVQEHEYICISYQTEITKWLKKCQREAVDHPALRETIKQYLWLVKNICGEDLDSELKQKVREIVEQNFETALRFKKFLVSRNDDRNSHALEENRKNEFYEMAIILINHSYNQVRLIRAKKILTEIYNCIKNELTAYEGFTVKNEIEKNKWNQILIRNDSRWPKNVWVTIQTQGTLLKGMIKIGVRANESRIERILFKAMLEECDIKYKNKPTQEFAAIENLVHFGKEGSDSIFIDEKDQKEFIHESIYKMLSLSKSLNQINDQNWRRVIK